MGFAKDEYLQKVIITQNKAVRAILGAKKRTECSKLYKDLSIVKLKDMFHINIAKFVWDFEKKSIPTCFSNYFQYAKTVHRYSTRYAASNKFSKTKTPSTSKFGLNSFKNVAINISNKLKDNNWYNSIETKQTFTKTLKTIAIGNY